MSYWLCICMGDVEFDAVCVLPVHFAVAGRVGDGGSYQLGGVMVDLPRPAREISSGHRSNSIQLR